MVSVAYGNMTAFWRAQFPKSIKVGDARWAEHELKLGSLNGNRFSLALRFLKCTEEEISKNAERIKSRGFINYFGL